MTTRTIEVSKDFYAELCEHLQPEERWVKEGQGMNLVLYTGYMPNGSYTQLTFMVKESNNERITPV